MLFEAKFYWLAKLYECKYAFWSRHNQAAGIVEKHSRM